MMEFLELLELLKLSCGCRESEEFATGPSKHSVPSPPPLSFLFPLFSHPLSPTWKQHSHLEIISTPGSTEFRPLAGPSRPSENVCSTIPGPGFPHLPPLTLSPQPPPPPHPQPPPHTHTMFPLPRLLLRGFATSAAPRATFNQVIRGARHAQPARKPVSPAMSTSGKPCMKAVCLKVTIMNPKKPNSADRKVARVRLSNDKVVTAYIPGEGVYVFFVFCCMQVTDGGGGGGGRP